MSNIKKNGIDYGGSPTFATSAEINDGTISNKAVSPAALAESNRFDGLGVGQTWQDVTSQRALNTVYTNTTGKPIFVSATAVVSSADALSLAVDGKLVDLSIVQPANFTLCTSGLVPDNSSYRMFLSNNAASLTGWRELR
ncbi:hypothetical protein FACS1894205_3210 [Alphaproteobacteria bacterium]|nr:hypothetical protein FACS1894205_3210 [Alphaproteobacteria bacterium]